MLLVVVEVYIHVLVSISEHSTMWHKLSVLCSHVHVGVHVFMSLVVLTTYVPIP